MIWGCGSAADVNNDHLCVKHVNRRRSGSRSAFTTGNLRTTGRLQLFHRISCPEKLWWMGMCLLPCSGTTWANQHRDVRTIPFLSWQEMKSQVAKCCVWITSSPGSSWWLKSGRVGSQPGSSRLSWFLSSRSPFHSEPEDKQWRCIPHFSCSQSASFTGSPTKNTQTQETPFFHRSAFYFEQFDELE